MHRIIIVDSSLQPIDFAMNIIIGRFCVFVSFDRSGSDMRSRGSMYLGLHLLQPVAQLLALHLCLTQLASLQQEHRVTIQKERITQPSCNHAIPV